MDKKTTEYKNKEFNYKNIRITTSYSILGKHVETTINYGDYFEIISNSDERAHKAFIALHNSKNQ